MDSEAYVAYKWQKLFEFINQGKCKILTLAEHIEVACRYLKAGKVDQGVQTARVMKEMWDRIFDAIGRPKALLSISQDDFVKGQLIVGRTDWYRREFIQFISKVMFDSMDTDGDGKISVEEWHSHYNTLKVHDEDFIQSIFTKMDVNGDGYISREEFDKANKIYANNHDPNNDYSFLYMRN